MNLLRATTFPSASLHAILAIRLLTLLKTIGFDFVKFLCPLRPIRSVNLCLFCKEH